MSFLFSAFFCFFCFKSRLRTAVSHSATPTSTFWRARSCWAEGGTQSERPRLLRSRRRAATAPAPGQLRRRRPKPCRVWPRWRKNWTLSFKTTKFVSSTHSPITFFFFYVSNLFNIKEFLHPPQTSPSFPPWTCNPGARLISPLPVWFSLLAFPLPTLPGSFVVGPGCDALLVGAGRGGGFQSR